jgi:hypothetical protein
LRHESYSTTLPVLFLFLPQFTERIPHNDDQILWYQNDGNQNFTEDVIILNIDGPSGVVTADADLDGDLDIFSSSFYDNKIAWHRNISIHKSAIFPMETLISDRVPITYAFTADVDQDGDLDILSASYQHDEIAWHENDGNQNFTEHIISTTASGVKDISAEDVDGDGDSDLLVVANDINTISWYENDGNQNFTEHIISTNTIAPNRVTTEDVDGDGDLDVLSASRNDDKIAWFENDGSQNFTEHIISTNADNARTPPAIDLDRDGDMDVLSASFGDDKIAWYENDGSQNFTEHIISTNADSAVDIFAINLDQDGDIDVLSASRDDNKIAWYENDGNQNFTEQIISTNADGAVRVVAKDVDGDGDLDVISGSSRDGKVAWYENDGNQNFTEQIVTTDAAGILALIVEDIDEDGYLDFLSGSGVNPKLAWYENKGGHFALTTEVKSSNFLQTGQTNEIFSIEMNHRGRNGDPDAELSKLSLFLEAGHNNPLTTQQANSLIERLLVYRDADGDGSFSQENDTLVVTVEDLNLTNGLQVVEFNDLDPNVQVSPDTPAQFFVTLELTEDATSQPNSRLRISHLTQGQFHTQGENSDSDALLTLEATPNVSSQTMIIVDNLIEGTADPDELSGTTQSDRIDGMEGDDSLIGGQNDDQLIGKQGNDVLIGGSGNDWLDGGSQRDWLNGGLGNDLIFGGEGADWIVLKEGEGSDTILNFSSGSDRFVLRDGLTFEQLSITEIQQGISISLTESGEQLAILTGNIPESLTSDDFVAL